MASSLAGPAEQEIAFGPFRFLQAQHLLLEGDRPVAVGSRALALLSALLERAGEVVSKEDLFARAWPDTFVEEGNLRVHIAALRRALHDGEDGNRYLLTIPGRGYSFVAPAGSSGMAQQRPPRSSAPHNLPPPPTGMIGRSDVVAALASQMSQRRFLSLVGPGGIGKTTVALAIANEVLPRYRDGAAFIDFVPISDPLLVPGKLASVLGLSISPDDPLSGVLSYLRSKEILLILDNCEHVIEPAASLAEDVFKSAPSVHILATSREPLRAAGERVHRLAPLEGAPDSANLTAAEALGFPGIELFVDRASAVSDEFEITDANAPVVAEVCRRLDGMPLAIELAAGRIDAFGVRGLADRLDDRFRLLTAGRRTALPRHQTLGATLDWSYDLLSAPEQHVLRSIGIFTGDFSLEAASSIASDPGSPQIIDHLATLVAKSLIAPNLSGESARYRLLDTTRAYCLDKLAAAGEREELARRHAQYYGRLFATAMAECDSVSKKEWLGRYALELDNLRAALDWAFSPSGDVTLGLSLTTGAVPLCAQLSLVAECRRWVERALALPPDIVDDRARMKLSAALGWSLMFSSGTARKIRPVWETTLSLAEQLEDQDCRLGALWGLWVDRLNNGAFREAFDLARSFEAIVADSTDSFDRVMAERLLGKSLYFLGEQGPAREHLERMFELYDGSIHQTRIARFQFDQGVTARYFQARILWLLGFPDRARQIVEANIEEARDRGHALTLSNALGQGACPVMLFMGDHDAAERFGTMLLAHSEKHGLKLWQSWARCFMAIVQIRRGDTADGIPALRAELDSVGDAIVLPRYLLLLGELATCLGRAGETDQALAAIERAIARCQRSEELWCFPELLRVKGELLLQTGGQGSDELFDEALSCARRQNTLSWELRAAMSLARRHRDRGRGAEAKSLLSEVYGRFTEGHQTQDLQTAKALIDECGLRRAKRRAAAETA